MVLKFSLFMRRQRDLREMPNSADAHLVDFLGLVTKVNATCISFAALVTVRGRPDFF